MFMYTDVEDKFETIGKMCGFTDEELAEIGRVTSKVTERSQELDDEIHQYLFNHYDEIVKIADEREGKLISSEDYADSDDKELIRCEAVNQYILDKNAESYRVDNSKK